MSNPYPPKVQQKLAHCRLALQLLSPAQPPRPSGQQELALLQAAAVHLAVAARLYLRELGVRLALKAPERIYQLEDLPDSPEVAELQAADWLPPLLDAEREVLNPLVQDAGSGVLIAGGRPAAAPLDVNQLQGWLTALECLIERQRQTSVEY